jgi:ADP-ribose pyrophosphatase YjhB (NUDIX family)
MRSMRALIQILYPVRRFLLALFRIRTRGVKVMVFNPAGELLLIRNSYGKQHLFVLPGGGIRPFETPEAAARREVKEEVGLIVERLMPRGTYHSQAEGKRDTAFLFTAVASGEPRSDSAEVDEARFFALDALPDTVSVATLRRIEEYSGERQVTPEW